MRRTAVRTWGGPRAQRLVAAVLSMKGRTCHLCGMDGADSADHNPPRSVLIRLGVTDPDAMRFLFPAHVRCNILRKARPITVQLQAELARARGGTPTTPTTRRSARFAR